MVIKENISPNLLKTFFLKAPSDCFPSEILNRNPFYSFSGSIPRQKLTGAAACSPEYSTDQKQ